MPAQNKHKAKASREWQKKHGLVQPKMTKKQKEKEQLKKLDSNWDRYDLPNADEPEELIGRGIDEFQASAKTASAFTTNYEQALTLNIGVPLQLERFEQALADLDYLRLMGLKPTDVNNDVEVLRALNHQVVKETKDDDDDMLRDELYEEWSKKVMDDDDENDKADSSDDEPVAMADEKEKEAPVEAVAPAAVVTNEPECNDEQMETKSNNDGSEEGSEDLEDWLDTVI